MAALAAAPVLPEPMSLGAVSAKGAHARPNPSRRRLGFEPVSWRLCLGSVGAAQAPRLRSWRSAQAAPNRCRNARERPNTIEFSPSCISVSPGFHPSRTVALRLSRHKDYEVHGADPRRNEAQRACKPKGGSDDRTRRRQTEGQARRTSRRRGARALWRRDRARGDGARRTDEALYAADLSGRARLRNGGDRSPAPGRQLDDACCRRADRAGRHRRRGDHRRLH